MEKTRLEAFSDGVFAIIITIMVLDLKVPPGDSMAALTPVLPVFFNYVLSFAYLGIYWNNHHHMIHTLHRVTGSVLWANLHLLFWLSLFPFATAWMGEHPRAQDPAMAYGAVLLAAALAYLLLQRAVIWAEGPEAILARAIGRDVKGKSSPVMYGVAISLASVWPVVAQVLYVLVALLWLVPDRRIERALAHDAHERRSSV